MLGCETSPEVGPFTKHELYHKTCVDVIRQYDCPVTSICALNCASDGNIDPLTTRMLPINNYGQYYLRIRLCMSTVAPQKLERYSVIDPGFCKEITDFTLCSRYVPPHSFIPVAIPITATSIQIDSCERDSDGYYICRDKG
jgi:hypothetical protein